jgi:uncharacterized protein YjbI with pentapeptide repeats
MEQTKLAKILKEHKLCLNGEGGKMADLRGADLRDVNLCGADLSCANLRRANMRGADLHGADLRNAYLSGANLHGADLRSANLRSADLCGADLRRADLRGADLCGANLRGADLCGANLRGADLCGADLDFAAFSLQCSSLHMKLSLDQIYQLLHFVYEQDSSTKTFRLIKLAIYPFVKKWKGLKKHNLKLEKPKDCL